jgi:hypothetical protein
MEWLKSLLKKMVSLDATRSEAYWQGYADAARETAEWMGWRPQEDAKGD